MHHWSLARDLYETIEEILGITHSVDYSVDGHYLHDITDDINSGKVECLALKTNIQTSISIKNNLTAINQTNKTTSLWR